VFFSNEKLQSLIILGQYLQLKNEFLLNYAKEKIIHLMSYETLCLIKENSTGSTK
jgi:hypothetical protein